ncbi:ROK family protein [Swaminathania salitolerans]|uniref:N-acetylglucosamine kinase n=1 Tax=Swaminathania salitolerans TaxID=182838 RepID=A0A511BM91_9PROT|nr:ROK family protein [Swaminathania salitolerans]GEL01202.1 N-acetylglucosamine kinase [Swaminathania salitolerans]
MSSSRSTPNPPLNPGREAVFCADIGGSYMRVARIDHTHKPQHEQRSPTPGDDLERFIATLCALIAASLEKADRQECRVDPGALHISLAGLQDPETDLCLAANIPCLKGVALRPLLAERLGMSVRIANDADCFALAESRIGAARHHASALGIILGSGIGGGLIISSSLVQGMHGLAGEWGHGPLVRPGDTHYPCLPCGCGQTGCLDTLGGARGLERLHEWLTGDARNSRAILEGWRSAPARYGDTMHRYIALVSDALAVAINTTGVTRIVAGGGLASDDRLLHALDEAVRHKILRSGTAPIIVKAELGQDAGLIGASFL